SNQSLIKGRVMEIGDREYTVRYGKEMMQESDILHVMKSDPSDNMICGNFATGEGIVEESIDCLICTQTLPFIYDLHKAAENMVRVLKKGGTALITVGGISQIISYERTHFGHYWSFTDMSMRMLFEELEDVESVQIGTYGNVKTASAFLYGISFEEMEPEDLDYHDVNYQLIVTAVVTKK
ncbi:MAG: class I SAM-dependent methyltransferase, partial [Lachnospiraceae bacterium]|nr:class I SAM-dependent methyltransferase [Lachnospiraceae bacterium]